MSTEKRKRCTNFSVEEKMRFLRILQKKGHVITSKVDAHDLTTNRLKEQAWIEIAEDLNATGYPIVRTTNNLKKLWQKMKTEAKVYKSVAYDDNEADEATEYIVDPVLEFVVDIISGSTGIETENDCDYELCANSPETSVVQDNNSFDTDIQVERLKTRVKRPISSIVKVEMEEVSGECIAAKIQRNIRRGRPILGLNGNERMKTKPHVSYKTISYSQEQIKTERERRSLLELQKQHMVDEHGHKMKQAEIKTSILEAVLKRIQDERPVEVELMKVISNM